MRWLTRIANLCRPLRHLWHRRVRLTVCWIVALAVVGGMFYFPAHWFPDGVVKALHLRDGAAWKSFAVEGHPQGTRGHTTIDFGGQYLMARMLVTGHGRSLYDRNVQRAVLEEAYNSGYHDPENGRSDAEALIYQLIDDNSDEGTARERGGALYPPVHALIFAPMGLLDPYSAYRTVQALHVVMTILLGVLVRIGTRGRVWAPVAIVAIVSYPGYAGSINLGQNSLLSLVLLSAGWFLLSRNRPLLGGICWGLMAYKPVWAVSFLFVPLLMARWRFVLSMCATGAGLVLLSLPFVGIDTWFDWLAVGKSADKTYITDENWVHLSRDVQGLLRRMLAEWPPKKTIKYRHGEELYRQAGVIPFVLVVGVYLVIGLLAALRRWREWRKLCATGSVALAVPERTDGPGAAFLLLGGWLACWHFMYYDLLVSALGVGVLFAAPGRYLWPVYLKRRDNNLPDDQKHFYGCTIGAKLPLRPDSWTRHWVSNPFGLILVVGLMLTWPIGTLVYDGTGVWRAPLDTWLLILLWGWCGWIWLVQPDFLAEPAANVLAGKSCSSEKQADKPRADAVFPEMPTSSAVSFEKQDHVVL